MSKNVGHLASVNGAMNPMDATTDKYAALSERVATLEAAVAKLISVISSARSQAATEQQAQVPESRIVVVGRGN